MKIYISGPMSGIQDDNKEAFYRMANLLQSKGHEPVNPHDISKEVNSRISKPSYNDYLKADLSVLMTCDAYVLLDGWRDSRGARIEKSHADDVMIPDVTAEIIN